MGKTEKILAMLLLTDLSIALHKAKPNTVTLVVMIAAMITAITVTAKDLMAKEAK